SEKLVADMLERTATMASYSTSMKLDYEHQRPLEVEAIVGNPLRAAQAQRADLIRIETVYRQLKMLDSRNRSLKRKS
ncbi:MAG: 2-dehydropantoate 2-reductase, partial [Synechococcaceae cyanobacterium RM1_1_27]|nr:2-dehydropantoate 2-reductase [Synechococcaceae cyanobacterium RM1_1_27]